MTLALKIVMTAALTAATFSTSEAGTRRDIENAIKGCRTFLKLPPAKQKLVAIRAGYSLAQTRWGCRTLVKNGVERTLRAQRQAEESGGGWSQQDGSGPASSSSSPSEETPSSPIPRNEHENETFKCEHHAIGMTCEWRPFECKPGPFGGTVCQ